MAKLLIVDDEKNIRLSLATLFQKHQVQTLRVYVDDWAKKHVSVVQQWIKDNPSTPQLKAPDLAVVFFDTFSKENPGRFPSAVTRQAGGKTITTIEPVKDGTDMSTFFDMWKQEHPTADLQDVPGDMVTTSGSGPDPGITLENADYSSIGFPGGGRKTSNGIRRWFAVKSLRYFMSVLLLRCTDSLGRRSSTYWK